MDARAEHFSVQEHALKQQSMEIDMALKELEGASKAHVFVGGLLVERDVSIVRSELLKKRETVTERLAALDRAHKK